jgi:RHS repeat-associated protein
VNAGYVYDALGRRLKKTGSTTAVYRYDGPNVLEEANGSGVVQATYVDGPWADEVVTMNRGGSTYGLFYDGAASVSDLTNANGELIDHYEFDPFGRPLNNSTVGNPYLFAGREYETDTGLYFSRARHYSPTLGRFLQRDPIGYAMGMNLYAYVGNNPLNWIDPLGLFQFDWGAFWGGAGQGALGGFLIGGGLILAGVSAPVMLGIGAIGLGISAYEIGSGRGLDGKKLTDSQRSGIAGGIAGGLAGGLAAGGMFGGGGGSGGPGEAYHYGFARNAGGIMDEGLVPGADGNVYGTPAGDLSPLQAQLDLALPPNRGLPDTQYEIDLNWLREHGYEIPEPTQVGRNFNMPGGGQEYAFPYPIPPEALTPRPCP